MNTRNTKPATAETRQTSGGCGSCQPSPSGGCCSGLSAKIEAILPRSNTDHRDPLPTASFAGSTLDVAPAPSAMSIAASSHAALEKWLGPVLSTEELDHYPQMQMQMQMQTQMQNTEGEGGVEGGGGGCGSGCGCSSDPSASAQEPELDLKPDDETDLGDLNAWIPPPPGASNETLKKLARREFLRHLLIGGIAGIGLAQQIACKPEDRAEMVQQHYYKMSTQDRKEVLARLEQEYWQKYRKKTTIDTTPAKKGVLFGYALDLSLCTGCRKCVYACVEENNLSRTPEQHWIKVLQMDSGHGLDLHHGTPFYSPEKVPEAGKTYVPVACQQCADPPCTKICPVGATWREPDGITVIDYNWCIGCRYCMAACPYDARTFNWASPSIPPASLNPDMHYLGNRPRMKGVVDKCTFCIQRVRKNKLPACVEACPVGARKFGDLNDSNGILQYLLKKKKTLVLKEDLNTKPQFFYYY